jgi:hypothetical protein
LLAWRRQLGILFPNVLDLSFSSYGAAGNSFKCDPAHFKPEVGVCMLNAEVIPVALRVVQLKSKRLPAFVQ